MSSKKLTVGYLHALYKTEHGNQSQLLLEGGDSKVRTLSPATSGVPLSCGFVNPYLHQLLSGEIDAVIFRDYGEQKITLKISLTRTGLDKTYHIQTNPGMRMNQVFEVTGIPITQFGLSVDTNL